MYKVVYDHAGCKLSCVTTGQAELQYSENHWTTSPWPEYGPLVFETLGQATIWLYGSDGTRPRILQEIWECETKEEIAPLPPICHLYKVHSGQFEADYHSPPWPKGTRMFKAVRLIRKVTQEEIEEAYDILQSSQSNTD